MAASLDVTALVSTGRAAPRSPAMGTISNESLKGIGGRKRQGVAKVKVELRAKAKLKQQPEAMLNSVKLKELRDRMRLRDCQEAAAAEDERADRENQKWREAPLIQGMIWGRRSDMGQQARWERT